ncbi:MAG: hypothetical protein IJD70_09980 [Clostridia bacterium]|nr:hypothetical protein [Clostridia bacterium]
MYFILDGVASPIPGIPFEIVLVLGIAVGAIVAVTAVATALVAIIKKKKTKKENN